MGRIATQCAKTVANSGARQGSTSTLNAEQTQTSSARKYQLIPRVQPSSSEAEKRVLQDSRCARHAPMANRSQGSVGATKTRIARSAPNALLAPIREAKIAQALKEARTQSAFCVLAQV